MCVQGYCPPVQAALEVYQLLSEPGVDLRQPVRMEKQLLEKHQSDMDTEVGASMLQLLQVHLWYTFKSACLLHCAQSCTGWALAQPFMCSLVHALVPWHSIICHSS